jgi:hypothetical protein
MTNSHFRRGSAAYPCGVCGKLTRETGGGESEVGLCAFCNEEGMLENARNDGHITEDQYEAKLAALKVKHGR